LRWEWTVSLPWEVRGLLAFRPDVVNAVSRIVTRTLNHWQRDRFPDDKTHAAGISVLHRFGSSLQVHPHVHSPLVEVVYVGNDGTVTLHDTPPPTLVDIEEIVDRVGHDLRAVLKRNGLVDEVHEPAQLDALARCMLHALNPPTRARAQPAAPSVDDDGYADPKGGLAVTVEGVNLHVSSRIAGHDRDALERVCRDLLRAPLRKLVIPAPSPRCKHHRPADKPPPPSSSYRLDWATLLRRTFGFTGLECTACGGPMKPIAVIEEPDEIRRYLAHLGLPTELPRPPRARAPPAEAA
jgi:hypothetical protein